MRTYGIIGLVDYGSRYLVVITERRLVATILGKAVYEIKDVFFLTMDEEILKVELLKIAHCCSNEEGDSEDDDQDMEAEDADSMSNNGHVRSELLQRESIVQDTMFRSNHSVLRRTSAVLSVNPVIHPIESDKKHNSLCVKLLSKIRAIYCTKGCYFSYQLELGKSLIKQDELVPPSKTWYYNWSLNRMFCGTPMELEVLQGYIGSYDFEWDSECEKEVAKECQVKSDNKQGAQLVVISRRSIRRPGVRYLRRGVDINGDCANWVETEQVLISDGEAYSFLQVRGSIPVYFSQSPYKLQPIPVLRRSVEDNELAFSKHFESLKKIYGDVVAVSLVEKQPSRESIVGELFAKLAEKHSVKLEWFDFHKICSGMHFENVKKLFQTKGGRYVQDFGFSTLHGGSIITQQAGVPRVNCMDCLDRTNVVQAAFARRALERQIGSRRPKNKSDFEMSFNAIWADNGDNISRQYSSTNALKGEFTRTQKRGIRSVLVDGLLTLSRYYYGIVSDFFTQATIDYITGIAGKQVLFEFEENLKVEDRATSDSKFETFKAIEFSANMMVPPEQALNGGWRVYSTMERGSVIPSKLEECVLLATSDALYLCFFSPQFEKMLNYIQISTNFVSEVRIGAFFTSVFSEVSRDSSRNIGIGLTVDGKGIKTADDLDTEAGLTRSHYIRVKIPSSSPVRDISETVQRICCNAEVLQEDLVSLEEARKNTRVWSLWQYNVKRAIWS